MEEKELLYGLTEVEVKERIAQGKQNDYQEKVAKTNQEIIKDNVFTLFNFLNLLIGLCLIAVGAYTNLFYLVIIILNTVIGIFQEIHARNLVEKLSLIATDKVTVMREGAKQKVDIHELVIDDIVIVSAGEQIPTDMRIVKGAGEANEASLTGESELIKKTEDAELFSGTYLVSGQCYGQVIHVGQDNYATKITAAAKKHKPRHSELLSAIQKVSKFTSFVIVPLGVFLFLEGYLMRQDPLKSAVVSSAAALLGMLPKGLVLLISISLATAVIKLAKKRILVQDMYAVETLAHVDLLCLDKTGTITEGKMQVQKVEYLQADQAAITDLIGSYLANSTDNNITMQALRNYFTANDLYEAAEVVPFSSERKWGAMQLKAQGTLLLGAPERLLLSENLPLQVKEAQENGYRALLFARTDEAISTTITPSKVEPLALFIIDDPIRKQAPETLAYLKEQGVELKVISGDNPLTVSSIAKKAGLAGYERYIDLSTLESDEEVRAAATKYTVFGRVSPEQKKLLVQEFKEKGHTVAMTGDGVNDVLALKEADCSIAMAEGDSATRQIANLVLLDSDFTHLPDVLFEGRRVVNNVTKVSSVFFIKTIYSFILSLICIATCIPFPFAPIQITLLDLAIEGYPSFFLSFEENKQQVRGKFLRTVLNRALPNALFVIGNILIVEWISRVQNWSNMETVTLMYYLLIAISVMAVLKVCYPFNKLRVFLFFTTFLGTYVAAMLFRSILQVGLLNATTWPIFLIMVVLTALGRYVVYYLSKV